MASKGIEYTTSKDSQDGSLKSSKPVLGLPPTYLTRSGCISASFGGLTGIVRWRCSRRVLKAPSVTRERSKEAGRENLTKMGSDSNRSGHRA